MKTSKCFVKHPTTGKTVLLQMGQNGYTELTGIMAEADPEALNLEIGVSKEQAQAMLIGSMFGWDAPGAKILYN